MARDAEGVFRRVRLRGPYDWQSLEVVGEPVAPRRFLSPVAPAAILCVAGNYRKHVEECQAEHFPEPVLFMKNPASATGHGEPIVIPAVCADEVDYECELAVVIGKSCREVTAAEASGYILGYTAANDVSARLWQLERGGGQWVRGKGFDTFCPLGPWLVTPDEMPDPGNLRLQTLLNGEVMQDARTAQMTGSIFEIIAFLSQGTTLLPGTVILTGTPEGVGWARSPRRTLQAGDEVIVRIEGLGDLRNPVKKETAS